MYHAEILFSFTIYQDWQKSKFVTLFVGKGDISYVVSGNIN